MARRAGKVIGLSEKTLKVYVSEETRRYLRRLYIIKKKKHEGLGSYSMSKFLREIISLYIRNNWETLESIEKAFRDLK